MTAADSTLTDKERAELASLILSKLKEELAIAAEALAHGNVGLASMALAYLETHSKEAYTAIIEKLYVKEMILVMLEPDSLDRVTAEMAARRDTEEDRERMLRSARLVVKGGGDPAEVAETLGITLEELLGETADA